MLLYNKTARRAIASGKKSEPSNTFLEAFSMEPYVYEADFTADRFIPVEKLFFRKQSFAMRVLLIALVCLCTGALVYLRVAAGRLDTLICCFDVFFFVFLIFNQFLTPKSIEMRYRKFDSVVGARHCVIKIYEDRVECTTESSLTRTVSTARYEALSLACEMPDAFTLHGPNGYIDVLIPKEAAGEEQNDAVRNFLKNRFGEEHFKCFVPGRKNSPDR